MPLIQCIDVQNVTWKSVSLSSPYDLPHLPQNTIHVWRIAVSETQLPKSKFKTILSQPELAKAEKFNRSKDRLQFITAKSFLKILLARYINTTPEQVQFSEELNGKPILQMEFPVSIEFNLSHAMEMILIALSHSKVGIDVEYIDRHLDFKQLIPHIFSTPECHFLGDSNNMINDFYSLWTRKEALVKATGLGISEQLTSIPCLGGPHQVSANIIGSTKDWKVETVKMEGGYLASIAGDPKDDTISFYQAEL